MATAIDTALETDEPVLNVRLDLLLEICSGSSAAL